MIVNKEGLGRMFSGDGDGSTDDESAESLDFIIFQDNVAWCSDGFCQRRAAFTKGKLHSGGAKGNDGHSTRTWSDGRH